MILKYTGSVPLFSGRNRYFNCKEIINMYFDKNHFNYTLQNYPLVNLKYPRIKNDSTAWKQ